MNKLFVMMNGSTIREMITFFTVIMTQLMTGLKALLTHLLTCRVNSLDHTLLTGASHQSKKSTANTHAKNKAHH
jgi:hypothetical protein